MKVIRGRAFAPVMLLALCSAAAYAQVSSGSVAGTVTDAQGAVVPGAKVTLTDTDQNTGRTVTASAEGTFTFTPVVAATYSVLVEAKGFKKYEKRDIIVHPNDHVGLDDIRLEVGATSDVVTIEANAVQLQTESVQRDSLLTGQQIVDLPIVDRSFMSLLQVTPGFTVGDRYSSNINGNRNDSMSIKVDGVSNMDSGVNMCCSTWVNLDTIEEFKVISNTQGADIGHAGGASVSVVTKSGTRQFHGNTYFFLRNESLNANSWMNNYNNARKTTNRANTEGFTLGGPIYIPKFFNTSKQKYFFFVSEEKQNSKNGGSINTKTVPTAAERLGDFSHSIDNTGKSLVGVIKDPTTGTPFTGGIIPSSMVNKDTQKLLNLMPLPNTTGVNTYNYVYAVNSTPAPDLIGTYKFDYNINPNWHAYLRYSRDYQTTYNAAPLGFPSLGQSIQDRKGNNVSVNTSTVVNPTVTNEATFGFSQNLIPQVLQNPTIYTRTAVGLQYTPLFPSGPAQDQGPQISFGGGNLSNSQGLGSSTFPYHANNTNWNFADNLAKVFAKHTVKVGFSWEHDEKDQTNGNPVGNFNFQQDGNNPSDTGFAFSNAILGVFDTYTQADQQREGQYRFANYEWYVDDTWKVSRKLTVSMGIRFYMLPPITDAKNQLGDFLPNLYDPAKASRLYTRAVNPANGKVNAYDPVTNTFLPPVYYGAIVPGSGNPINGFVLGGTNGVPAGLVQTQHPQYGPRLGLAYQLNAKTVIRFGGGIFYDRIQGNPWYTNLGIPPTTRQATLYYGNVSQLTSLGATYFPPNPGNNGAGLAPDGHLPTVYNYNFTVQRELPFHIVADVAYVGNINRHLLELVNINAPAFGSSWLPQNQDPTANGGVPKYDGTTSLLTNFFRPYIGVDRLNLPEWGGTANYNSLQATAARRVSRSLVFTAAYTFSKALGTADSIYNASAIPGQVRSANYGRLSYDRPQRLVLSYTYTLPKGVHGSNAAVNNFATRIVLNDWQVSGISTFASGAPATVGFNVNGVNLNSLTGNPDYGPRVVINGNPSSGSQSLIQWFNPGVFAPAQKGSKGNDSGFNYITLPGQNNTDLTLFKNAPFGKGDAHKYVQFRLEAYNFANHTQWSGVNTTATFASLTSNTITNLADYSKANRFNFGAANAVRSPRTMQVSLKIYF